MDEVHRLLRYAGVTIERVAPSSPAARHCVARYFAELDRRFPQGFDPAASLSADDEALTPPRGMFLVARARASRWAAARSRGWATAWSPSSACGSTPPSGGSGSAAGSCPRWRRRTRVLGFSEVRLETNGTLTEAMRLYRTAGYREVDAFNDDPYAQHWFAKRLGDSPPASG